MTYGERGAGLHKITLLPKKHHDFLVMVMLLFVPWKESVLKSYAALIFTGGFRQWDGLISVHVEVRRDAPVADLR